MGFWEIIRKRSLSLNNVAHYSNICYIIRMKIHKLDFLNLYIDDLQILNMNINAAKYVKSKLINGNLLMLISYDLGHFDYYTFHV